ncbi:hypothetical protein [Actinoplanes sp. NPDC026623]|uniref:nSTAND1 domain-containing NTPase n=1 Tax=Actinoplanes sp. NPDC026623 TaxID=3155610 RepID=UPI0033F5BA53
MGRPERPIDPEAGPLPRFAFDLRHLREKAGSPSYRQLARQAHYSATALSEAAGALQLPSLAVTLAYVRACDGDPVERERRWREVAAAHEDGCEDRPSPYLGLAAFQPADADRFFGRESLVAELVDRLGRQRLIVLFGPSGSGKSSIEEVFTMCDDAGERRAFVEALVAAAESTRVVVAARADFLGHCAEFPGLVLALRDAQFLVGPMQADELRQAIEGPAARHGLRVDNDMVAAALADVRGQPGALPLLSHALLETWHRREKNRLTLAGYQASGGVHGAIAATAERAFAELTAEGRSVARSLLLRLVQLNDDACDVRRRAALSEVLGMGRSAETARVLDRLATARLVVVTDDSVELGHEAVARAWPRLQRWIAEDRQALRVHRQLTIAAGAWEAVGRDPGALYRGVQLAAVRDLAGRADWVVSSSAVERQFVRAGAEAEAAAHGVALRQAAG